LHDREPRRCEMRGHCRAGRRLTMRRLPSTLSPPRETTEVPTMRDAHEHALIPTLKRQLAERQIDRREFLRYSILLGMSTTAAYAAVRRITGEALAPAAAAQHLPRRGTLRPGRA